MRRKKKRNTLAMWISHHIFLLCCCDVERHPGPPSSTFNANIRFLIPTFLRLLSGAEFRKGLYKKKPSDWNHNLWFGDPNNGKKNQTASKQNLLEMLKGIITCLQRNMTILTEEQYEPLNTFLSNNEQIVTSSKCSKKHQMRKDFEENPELVLELLRESKFQNLKQRINEQPLEDSLSVSNTQTQTKHMVSKNSLFTL